jgi:hypothetical protein
MRNSIAVAVFASLLFVANAPAHADTVDAKGVSALEHHFFERTYNNEPMPDRLTRLEKMIFGEVQKGSDDDRWSTILTTVPAKDLEPEAQSEPQTANAGQSSGQTADGGTADDFGMTTQTADPITNSSDYPHITNLEKELLGQTHVGDSLAARLSRLEVKAFGHPSQNNDLSARTDNLEQYVEVHLHAAPFGINPKMDDSHTVDYASVPMTTMPAPYAPPPVDPVTTQSAPPPAGTQLKTRVAWMEMHVYGKTFPDLHLLERLHQLDATLFPNHPHTNDRELMDQVDALVGAVMQRQPHATQPVQTAQLPVSQPQYPQARAYSPSPSPYQQAPYQQAPYQQAAYQQAAYQQPDPSHAQQQDDHPFLKQFASLLGVAGNMGF